MIDKDFLRISEESTPEKYCAYCGKRMYPNITKSGKVQSLSAFKRRKYCDQQCCHKALVNVGVGSHEFSTSHHSARAIKYLILGAEKKCERCGSSSYVDVHHKDGDYTNNNPNNLICLCKSCHLKEHRHRNYCVICGKPVKGHGYCCKHYQRWKTYGDPMFTKRKKACK